MAETAGELRGEEGTGRIDIQTHPDAYRHWKLTIDGNVARLAMDVDEDATLAPGYSLKLNSYDLGVDIELYDAIQRLRFEHPEVGCVVMTSDKPRVFCAGANINMLGRSSHAHKVNFCKFTNETRNGIEDATGNSRQTYICAINGTAAGGGYELALACDYIMLIDDGSSTVSLPELPLLAVLPGTGGLTRLVDKRKVRHDHADFFCTTSEGMRGRRAVDWNLIDELVPGARFQEIVSERAREFAGKSDRPKNARGVALAPLNREVGGGRIVYEHVTVALDRADSTATISIRAPETAPPATADGIHEAGTAFWPFALARELDDAIMELRLNEQEIGTWVFRTEGDAALVAAADKALRGQRRRLAGARDRALSQARAQAGRRELAQPDRADRARQLFRRHPAGARTGKRSRLHAGRRLRGQQRAARDGASHGHEFRPLHHVERSDPAGEPASSPRPAGSTKPGSASASRSRRRMPRRSGWSLSSPTTSTGKTRSVSSSRSARASPPMR